MKRLRLEKDAFYTQGPSKETKAKNWDYPGGLILKNKVPLYVEADKDILELQAQIDESQIKVDALEKMVQSLSFRGNLLKFILEVRKYEGGA